MLDRVRRDNRRSLRACSSLRAGRPGVSRNITINKIVRYPCYMEK